jgi:hypothetical protein
MTFYPYPAEVEPNSLRITRSLPVHDGTTVTIVGGLSTAKCRVVYDQANGRDSHVLGLEYITQSDQLRVDSGQAIAALRRDHGQIAEAWHHSN